MTDSRVNSGERSDEVATSSTLLREAKAANRDAWERLVELYSPLVYRWCRRQGLQPADALDVGQEVFQAVARQLGKYRHDRPGDTFRGWLRIITRRKVYDLGRVKARLPQRAGSDVPAPMEQPAGHSPGEEIAESTLVLRRVLEIVRRTVEPRTWAAFWAVAAEGRRPVDVADDLAMSRNAVHLAKSRILGKLREILEKLPDPESF